MFQIERIFWIVTVPDRKQNHWTFPSSGTQKPNNINQQISGSRLWALTTLYMHMCIAPFALGPLERKRRTSEGFGTLFGTWWAVPFPQLGPSSEWGYLIASALTFISVLFLALPVGIIGHLELQKPRGRGHFLGGRCLRYIRRAISTYTNLYR